MPDVIVTEAPPPSGPPNPLLGATPGDTFDNAMRGRALEPDESDANSAAGKPTEKAVDAKGADVAAKSTIPESLLATKVAPSAEPNHDATLAWEPEGQLTHKNYKALKIASKWKIDNITTELEAVRKERDDYKSKAGTPTDDVAQELTELREQLKQARTTLEQEAYQRTPEFHEKFTSEEQNIRTLAENVLKTAGVDAAILDSVIHGVGRNRFAPLTEAELNEHEVDYIRGLVKDYDKLQPAKKAALDQAHDKMTRAQQERQGAQDAEKRQRVAEEALVFERIDRELMPALDAVQKATGDDEAVTKWNTGRDELRARWIKHLNGNGDFEEFATVALKGICFDDQAKLTKAWREKSEAQAEELARIKAASPSAAGANGQRQRDASQHDFTGLTSWDELVGRK